MASARRCASASADPDCVRPPLSSSTACSRSLSWERRASSRVSSSSRMRTRSSSVAPVSSSAASVLRIWTTRAKPSTSASAAVTTPEITLSHRRPPEGVVPGSGVLAVGGWSPTGSLIVGPR